MVQTMRAEVSDLSLALQKSHNREQEAQQEKLEWKREFDRQANELHRLRQVNKDAAFRGGSSRCQTSTPVTRKNASCINSLQTKGMTDLQANGTSYYEPVQERFRQLSNPSNSSVSRGSRETSLSGGSPWKSVVLDEKSQNSVANER
eukprot:Filipodium_phascolosomae@DN6780_c0_g1_i1.p1